MPVSAETATGVEELCSLIPDGARSQPEPRRTVHGGRGGEAAGRSQPLALGRITERTKCRWICLTVSASHTSRPRTEPSSCRTQAAIPAMAPRAPQLICLRHPSRPLVPPMPALADGARAKVLTQRQPSCPATVHICHAAARTGRARARALVDAAWAVEPICCSEERPVSSASSDWADKLAQT